jgi:hypothetical protein
VRRAPLAQAEIPPPRTTARGGALDALAHLPTATIAERYAAASAPPDISAIEGDPDCLALPGNSGLQRWAASERSPWIGKSFRQVAPDRLTGHNRLGLLGGARALPFTATIGPSLLDHRPALILRYDTPNTTNPWWQRRIHDELREIEPRLLAGPVIWLGRHRPRTVCWFAVATRKTS